MVLDGVAFTDPETGTFLEPSGVAAFIAHCREDPLAPLGIAEQAYDLLGPPKYLVVLEGVCHAEAFEDAPHDLDDVATAVTTEFWKVWLAADGDRDAEEALSAALDAFRDELVWESAVP
jgi:hypothetical protein